MKSVGVHGAGSHLELGHFDPRFQLPEHQLADSGNQQGKANRVREKSGRQQQRA